MRRYSIKLDIIEESLRVSAEKPKNAELIKLILSELRWFNGERNKYAHAIYIGTGKIGVVRRRAFHSDTQRNYHECELDTEDVEMQIERAKKLHITMYHHLLPHGSFDTRP